MRATVPGTVALGAATSIPGRAEPSRRISFELLPILGGEEYDGRTELDQRLHGVEFSRLLYRLRAHVFESPFFFLLSYQLATTISAIVSPN